LQVSGPRFEQPVQIVGLDGLDEVCLEPRASGFATALIVTVSSYRDEKSPGMRWKPA
jgi:hypothetical protein